MEQELEFAKELAKQAGQVMRDKFALVVEAEWKEDNTPLTVADTQINQLVECEVKQKFPGDGVLGEEGSFNTTAKRLWVVDPIDGTMLFSNGVPDCVFSLALAVDGESVVAVVYEPFTDRLFWASKDQGAFMNGQHLNVNQQAELNERVFIDLAGKEVFGDYNLMAIMQRFVDSGVRVTRSYTAAYNSLPVAAGGRAAMILLLNHPWDGVAVSLLVTEAGGTATDLTGGPLRWDGEVNGLILSNGLLHDQLAEIVNR